MTKNKELNFKIIRNDELTKQTKNNTEKAKEDTIYEKPNLKIIENNDIVQKSQNNQTSTIKEAIDKVKDSVLLTEKSIEVINEDGSKAELERIISENQYIVLVNKGLGNTFFTAHTNELHANLIAKSLKWKTTIKLGTTFSTNIDFSSDNNDSFYIVQDYFFADEPTELKESKMQEWLEVYPNAIFKQI